MYIEDGPAKKLFCVVMSDKRKAKCEDRHLMVKSICNGIGFSPLKDGEMAMVYSATAKRHKIS